MLKHSCRVLIRTRLYDDIIANSQRTIITRRITAADARLRMSAICGNLAAIDSDSAANCLVVVAAADTGRPASTCRRDITTIDSHLAAADSVVAANASAAVTACHDKFAHSRPRTLSVNRQRIAGKNGDASLVIRTNHRQRRVVAENEAHFVADDGTRAQSNVAGYIVPAIVPHDGGG